MTLLQRGQCIILLVLYGKRKGGVLTYIFEVEVSHCSKIVME